MVEQFTLVAKEQGKALPGLSDDLTLVDSGLDSLCLAILVARLEDTLGVDPFNTEAELVFPATVGEFIELYQRAAH